MIRRILRLAWREIRLIPGLVVITIATREFINPTIACHIMEFGLRLLPKETQGKDYARIAKAKADSFLRH